MSLTSKEIDRNDWYAHTKPDAKYMAEPLSKDEIEQWRAADAMRLATYGETKPPFAALPDVENMLTDMEKLLDEVEMTPTGSYPPTNIIRTKLGYRIEIALAGFFETDISVYVEDNRVLHVQGAHDIVLPNGEDFVTQGIAKRKFARSFQLGKGVEVIDSTLKDGILTVNLTRHVPEPTVKTIPINKKPQFLTEKSPTYVPPNTGITGVTYKANNEWLMSHAALTASPAAVPTDKMFEGMASYVAPGVDITVKHT